MEMTSIVVVRPVRTRLEVTPAPADLAVSARAHVRMRALVAPMHLTTRGTTVPAAGSIAGSTGLAPSTDVRTDDAVPGPRTWSPPV
jgi:hypothetical protein